MPNVFYFDWEVRSIEFLQNNLPDLLMSFMKVITDLGDEMAIICVAGLIYWCLDKKTGKRLCLYLGVSNICYPMIKNIVLRSRPYMDVTGIECLKAPYKGDMYDLNVQGYAFPSGHAANCVTVYGAIFMKYRNLVLRIAMIVIIVLVCVSRCALGVHYPTDMAAGIAVALAVMVLLDQLDRRCKSRKYYIVIAVAGLAGFFFCRSTDYYTGYGIMLGAMISDVFEERFVDFEKASGIAECVLRMAGGLIIFLAMSTLLKLPFSESFLASKTVAAFAVRSIRYTLLMFIDLGLYPMLFRYMKKPMLFRSMRKRRHD